MSKTRAQIAALREKGRSVSEIACGLDLAPQTVRYHLARLDEAPDAAAVTPLESGLQSARIDGATRERVRALLDEGLARREIASRLGLSKAAVSYHARQLGAHIDQRCARRYDWSAIQEFHDAGHGMRQCAARFGFSPASWSQAVARGAITPRPSRLSISELCVDGKARGRNNLKARLLREGLKSNRCEQCGLAEWLERPITLALHHVNGQRDDNRLENLQLLCPNCHSQTENFAGRRRRHAPPHPESS